MPTFPNFFFSASPDPKKDIHAEQVGSATAEISGDQYIYHSHMIKWIEETKQKLPTATPLIRREAFLADPLLKGTIYPYLKNVLLQGFSIQSKDNKLYSEAIEEIKEYLESIELIKAFRDDFINFAILDGHSYRRMDMDQEGNVIKLGAIEPASVTTYTDPWDSSIIAYHQHSSIRTAWSKNGTNEYIDSWFIPYGKEISYLNAVYVTGQTNGNDPNVLSLFEQYKIKYSITDIKSLRIAASERVISMHNSERIDTVCTASTNQEIDNPAPIDTILLAIWLKRLLLVNSPNLIYVVLSPFLHLISGVLKETKDFAGNPMILSSNPQKPNSALQAANPTEYNRQLANYEAWIEAMQEAGKKLIRSLKNGGVFQSGPDLAIKTIESSRTVSFQLIKGLIDQLNEEIGQAFGFPIALVRATGAELASSRNILQMFNTVHAGERIEYEAVADKLIKNRFAETTWQGTTIVNEKEVQVTYSFDEIKARFVLDTPDTKDLLNEAQAFKTKAETLVQLKTIGAGKEDLQALGEEAGFGILALDGEPVEAPIDPAGAKQVNAILKSFLAEMLKGEGVISAKNTDPSGFKENEIVDKLQEAYQTAKESMDVLFEEN